MSVSRKVERELLREKYVKLFFEFAESLGEDVHLTKSNEFGFPVVGCEDNEDFIVCTIKVPTGSNKGTEPYDLYGEAETYQMKQTEKERKKKEAEKKKLEKIAKDKAIREKKKEISEKGE